MFKLTLKENVFFRYIVNGIQQTEIALSCYATFINPSVKNHHHQNNNN